jgi:hypothetical protein
VELNAVIHCELHSEDGSHQAEDRVGVIAQIQPSKVDVTRRATSVERREQDPTLQDELLPDVAHGEARQEAFEHVELEQLVRRSPGPLRLPLEIEVRITVRRAPRHPTHSRTSNV